MDDLRRKNRRVLTISLCFVAGMVALAYASVPLYDMLCRVTGWGGTTRMVAENPNTEIFDREVTVRFNTDVQRGMPWRFTPERRSTKVKVGQDGLIAFIAENLGAQPVTGTAVYNVTPLKAGKYFYKTQCFCFGEQTLNPGETVNMPVVFFVDPKIMEDRSMDDVTTITLSYSFFPAQSPALEKALEKFYSEQPKATIN